MGLKWTKNYQKADFFPFLHLFHALEKMDFRIFRKYSKKFLKHLEKKNILRKNPASGHQQEWNVLCVRQSSKSALFPAKSRLLGDVSIGTGCKMV